MHVRLLRPLLSVALWAAVLASAQRSFAGDTATAPYPGIQHIHRETASPNRQLHLVQADLTRGDVRIRATKPGDRGRTVRSMANLYDCEIAINGDFFTTPGYVAWGLAIGFGERWTDPLYPHYLGYVAFGNDNRAQLGFPPAAVNPPEPWMVDAVSGAPAVLQGGSPVDPDCTNINHDCISLHPRTGIGLSQDGKTLYLVVIDGRSSIAIGAPTREVGEFMGEFGAWSGINLDGGGSSTLYIASEGGVVNHPSDGVEREVANHLCIDIVPPFGVLSGYVREGGITDTNRALVGATVSLSTGGSTRTDESGFYTIHDVPRGNVSVTATLSGFSPATESVFVPAAEETTESLALTVASDAGALRSVDPEERAGGPSPMAPVGGCGCEIHRTRLLGASLGPCLVALFALGTYRRRVR